MKTKLMKGCSTPKEKQDRKEYLLAHKELFDLLKSILEDDLRMLDKEQSSTKRYDDQSWAYKQADYNGCKRTYDEVISILTIGDTK